MQKIPKIIHQVWGGGTLPDYFKQLSATWKRDYPDWQYVLWDDERIDGFIREFYPQYRDIYSRFPYHVQRWDAIRYLFLQKMGGMYVDVDYESIEPMDNLIDGKTCCFAQEPLSERDILNYKKVDRMFNNAMMLSVPQHPFMDKVIEAVFREDNLSRRDSKAVCVLETTGPRMLVDTYNRLIEAEKSDIYLLPTKYVTPFNIDQARRFLKGERSEELHDCMGEAYAVHYFIGSWRGGEK